jgi:hypothetical protein
MNQEFAFFVPNESSLSPERSAVARFVKTKPTEKFEKGISEK